MFSCFNDISSPPEDYFPGMVVLQLIYNCAGEPVFHPPHYLLITLGQNGDRSHKIQPQTFTIMPENRSPPGS